MSNPLKVIRLAKEIAALDTADRNRLLAEIVKDEHVSVTELLTVKIANLETFRDLARTDMTRIAEAGIELAEPEVRKVAKIGGRVRKKSVTFRLAMLRCLLDARAYEGTEYGRQLESTDFSAIDSKWYEDAWKPQSISRGSEQLKRKTKLKEVI